MSKDKKNKITVKQTLTQDGVVTYLEDLLKSFKAGQLIINNAEDSVTLNPSEEINFELKAGSKKGKTKFSMKFSWQDQQPENDELSISTEKSDNDSENAD
ncbi:amphi-Trp domain-containing protein [Desulfovibrio sp. UCD-KL4C]|uniref:amphi-Trp domain-containing protein n=1 Tax=Desulfovibrio sp. UCD-KL4C TaxID=2578120 RepID=UPI0025BCFCAA|nr:amphi-Trp domain-containing protein [Desulfovibrio sp. UCD-KL4C]